jgi:hypothetical protein
MLEDLEKLRDMPVIRMDNAVFGVLASNAHNFFQFTPHEDGGWAGGIMKTTNGLVYRVARVVPEYGEDYWLLQWPD